MSATFISLYCLIAVYAAVKLFLRHRRKSQYPPGPTGVPFFGNIFQLSEDLWLPFTTWKEEYGPIFYLNIAGQPVVVLNTYEAAADLLDRRAANYSDRPQNIVASDMLTGGLMIVFGRYNNIWRRMRRASHEELNKTASASYQPTQTAEAVTLVNDLITNPRNCDKHIKRASGSTMVSVVYGLPMVTSEEDRSVRHINDFTERIVRAALPGAHLVEFFPWMRHLPVWLARWKRDALEWYRKDSVMFEGLFKDVETRLVEDGEKPSFCSSLIRGREKYVLNDRESAWLAATMYAAGADTTSATMSWFFTAMAAYPEVQKRAQAELDAVVGRARMPTFADLPELPYIRAIIKEVMRWRPVGPVGLPHRSLEDDWYNGYLIPGGTICIANVWALHHDRQVYGEDADHFNPARYLNEDGLLKASIPDTKDEGHAGFGFGRRICPGRYVANSSLFIDIACVLWSIDICPLDGKCPDTEKGINLGVVVRPVPIDYKLTPRFPDVVDIVAQTKELSIG